MIPIQQQKNVTLSDDMIADITTNKKFHAAIKEIFQEVEHNSIFLFQNKLD